MSASEALAAVREAVEKALAVTGNATAQLSKLGNPASQSATASLLKMTQQLDAIRAGIVVLEAYEHAQPQHWRTQ